MPGGATKFGAAVPVKPPQGTTAIWKVSGDGALGALDLFVSVSTPEWLATWHTQVLPGLTVRAKKGAKTVVFTVSDAGDPVAGAKVKFGKKTLTTNARGQATGPRRSGRATASKAGYTAGSVTVS